jgi:ATPase subunit of ABC transporter with duplicated ATPase domains
VLPEDEARTLLAHYRLGADAIDRPMGRLSPGERARVHVAAIVASGADLVLLDEPTNHLDFDTLEVIEAALRAYRGTLVVASHDAALLEAVGCERVVEVRDGRAREAAMVS